MTPAHPSAVSAAEGLLARLGVNRSGFRLDLGLRLVPGETVALLGPNGAGKTTTLQVLAGLLALTDGRVELAGELLDDPVCARFVHAAERRVGMVFQDYLLFPHLSAADNVAFGLRARGVPRKAATARAHAWLDRVGLGAQVDAKPRALSGGQAQRVALARALATEPRLLLLDEPLAALDAGTRAQVRADLRRHLDGYAGCALVVTHDPLDAMVLADRLVVIEAGRLVQEGAPAEVARAPRTEYVARLVGLNLYRGTSTGMSVTLPAGGRIATADVVEGPVFVAFPPSAVALYRRRPQGSPRNCWPGRVDGVEQHGHTVRVRLQGPVPVLADVTAGAVADLSLVPGAEVWAAVKATEVHAYPA